MQTKRKAASIAYTKDLENRVTVLQIESDKTDALTVFPPSDIITNTGMSDTSATLMVDLCKDCKTRAESMAQLTKMMTMFLTKSLAGEPTGGIDKDRHRGGGGREIKLIPL